MKNYEKKAEVIFLILTAMVKYSPFLLEDSITEAEVV